MVELSSGEVMAIFLKLPRAVCGITIAVLILFGLSLYRRRLVPQVINLMWFMSAIFFMGGMGRFVGIVGILAGWKYAEIIWDCLIDLMLLGFIVLIVRYKRFFEEFAEYMEGRAASALLDKAENA